MFPFYNFIAFNDEGQWGWTAGIGKFRFDPFLDEHKQPQLPSEIGFTVLHAGAVATAWERVFDNGYVRITDLTQTTHEFGRDALITYFDRQGKVMAQYEVTPQVGATLFKRRVR